MNMPPLPSNLISLAVFSHQTLSCQLANRIAQPLCPMISGQFTVFELKIALGPESVRQSLGNFAERGKWI